MRSETANRSERGAVLVHVALALLALMSLTTFVVDYGALWTSRGQAQNAADAAALAGAVSLAYDNNPQTAHESATSMLQSHWIWGQPPIVNPTDITISPCPDDVTQTCVKVDVYRNQARGNPIPMIFGRLLGLTHQGVRATATGQVFVTNSGDCFKPWGLADKWTETDPSGWGAGAYYNPPLDSYAPPSSSGPGTGFTVQADHGRALHLKLGQSGDVINGGWFQAINTERNGNMAAYQALVAECEPALFKIGDSIPRNTRPYGTLLTETQSGVGSIIAHDPLASWDPTANGGQGGVINSCAQATPPCVDSWTGLPHRVSPRVVTVPVFDLDHYMATGGPGAGTVRVVNMVGFFVSGMVGNDVFGYVVSKPGVQIPCSPGPCPTAHGSAVFTKITSLVR